ncbi:hypothetical protein [Donghicola tyrosinivorans]|uniref:Uncharacterized protein n=1 Tax=Donghicola tyrosinivorans TaxID=1652492 RepID=A0A2T0WTZ2_9RHOB|nr:hypothetical protein [Donghicola tyrosinivorans]PRY90165.1 hypothetical protein CLV74_105145 [Donghicola tyrosinivorans]
MNSVVHLCANLLRDEYFSIFENFSRLEAQSLWLTLWAVSVVLGILVFAVYRRSPVMVLVSTVAAVAFWSTSDRMQQQQDSYLPRMAQIEGICMAEMQGPAISLTRDEDVQAMLAPDPMSGGMMMVPTELLAMLPVNQRDLPYALAFVLSAVVFVLLLAGTLLGRSRRKAEVDTKKAA